MGTGGDRVDLHCEGLSPPKAFDSQPIRVSRTTPQLVLERVWLVA